MLQFGPYDIRTCGMGESRDKDLPRHVLSFAYDMLSTDMEAIKCNEMVQCRVNSKES